MENLDIVNIKILRRYFNQLSNVKELINEFEDFDDKAFELFIKLDDEIEIELNRIGKKLNDFETGKLGGK